MFEIDPLFCTYERVTFPLVIELRQCQNQVTDFFILAPRRKIDQINGRFSGYVFERFSCLNIFIKGTPPHITWLLFCVLFFYVSLLYVRPTPPVSEFLSHFNAKKNQLPALRESVPGPRALRTPPSGPAPGFGLAAVVTGPNHFPIGNRNTTTIEPGREHDDPSPGRVKIIIKMRVKCRMRVKCKIKRCEEDAASHQKK